MTENVLQMDRSVGMTKDTKEVFTRIDENMHILSDEVSAANERIEFIRLSAKNIEEEVNSFVSVIEEMTGTIEELTATVETQSSQYDQLVSNIQGTDQSVRKIVDLYHRDRA